MIANVSDLKEDCEGPDSELRWNFYICKEEDYSYSNCTVQSSIDVALFENLFEGRKKVVASLEDISQEERNGLFGIYEGQVKGQNYIERVVDSLDMGFLDGQGLLDVAYEYVRERLERD